MHFIIIIIITFLGFICDFGRAVEGRRRETGPSDVLAKAKTSKRCFDVLFIFELNQFLYFYLFYFIFMQ